MKTLSQPETLSPRPRRRVLRRSLTAAFLASSILTPTAAFASGDAVVADCADDGKLDRKYSAGDYASALKNIPTDVDEYTDCRDIIKRGQLGLGGSSSSSGSSNGSSAPGGGGTSGGGTGGGSTASGGDTGASGGSTSNGLNSYDQALAGATPEQRATVQKMVTGNPTAVDVAGQQISPGSLSHGDLGSLNSLPGPLVIVLLLLGLGAVLAVLPTIRTLVRTRLQRTA